MTIGQEITQLRKLHKMSRKELSDKLGLNEQKIMYWELDLRLPTFSELIGLRQAFNITSDSLLGGFSPSQAKGGRINNILLALFILSFLCIPFALYLVSIPTMDSPGQPMTEHMWLFYLLLPIPVASMVLGTIYTRKGLKAKRNIVAGAILTVLLVLYGSFTFIFGGMYSHDYSYIYQIETAINFNLPDTGRITTQNLTKSTAKTGSVQYLSTSDAVFMDESEILAFDTAIKSSKLWVTSVSTQLSSIIPLMYSIYTSGTTYNYFMVYNVDLKNYNTFPGTSGKYCFIFLAYDNVEHMMKIGKYTLDVS